VMKCFTQKTMEVLCGSCNQFFTLQWFFLTYKEYSLLLSEL